MQLGTEDDWWQRLLRYRFSPGLFMTCCVCFLCGIHHQQRCGFAFVQGKWLEAVDSLFALIRGPLTADTGTTAVCTHLETCGSLGGWPTFAPLLERAARCVAEHTACNVIPTDCRCKALQVSTNEALQMLSECSLLCMHMSSQHRPTPKCILVYFKCILMLLHSRWCPCVSVLIVLRRMNVKHVDTGMFIVHVVKNFKNISPFYVPNYFMAGTNWQQWRLQLVPVKKQARRPITHTSPKTLKMNICEVPVQYKLYKKTIWCCNLWSFQSQGGSLWFSTCGSGSPQRDTKQKSDGCKMINWIKTRDSTALSNSFLPLVLPTLLIPSHLWITQPW